MRQLPPDPKPYKPIVPRWGRTFLYWRIMLCCRHCEETVARSSETQERLIANADRWKGYLFDAWTAARQQNKGMNRMARKIKRLQAELELARATKVTAHDAAGVKP